MTDYYKTALEVLSQILREEKHENWANWMQEDLKLWETNKSVEHHLRAYGGMGSFNDVVVGGNNNEGIWKAHIFGHLQGLTYSLAKGDSLEKILETISNQPPVNVISGWRCRTCGDARMTDRDINLFIANYFIPQFFVQYVQEDRLKEVFDIPKLIDSEEVIAKKSNMKSLIQQANIILNPDDNWHWTCPKCGSSEVCVFRWIVAEGGTGLVEGEDNLSYSIV
jgi:hypothetical protein